MKHTLTTTHSSLRRFGSLTLAWVPMIALCAASSASAQSLSVTVVGTTATQALLSYSAPDTNACAIEVSEAASFAPVVHDVDPTLYASANMDTRDGAITNGKFHIFVAGRRSSEVARDGNTYSRALQANTQHYFRIKCGAAVGQGTFTTANIPLGMTYTEPPQADLMHPGQLALPTLMNTRGTTVVDPQTGALLKRVTTLEDSDHSGTGAFLAFGGFIRLCSPNLVGPGPGYLCSLANDSGYNGFVYYIIPSSGEVRFLGVTSLIPSPWLDPVDNKLYTVSTTGNVTTIRRGQYSGTYASVNPGSVASFTWETFFSGSPGALLHGFEPSFDASAFACSFNVGGQYALMNCLRNWQDSYGWVGVVDMGNRQPIGNCGSDPAKCPHVIAAAKVYEHPSTRWCGLHNIQLLPGALVGLTTHGITGPDGILGAGPYYSILPVVSRPDKRRSRYQESRQALFREIRTFPRLRPVTGSTFRHDERVKLTRKDSATSWQISRNVAVGHAAGTRLILDCAPAGANGYAMTYWKFLADPHATDTTNRSYIVDGYWPYGGHDDWSDNLRLTEGYLAIPGPIASNINTPITFNMDESPMFAGARGLAYGNSTQKHPSYHQSMAPQRDQNWFLDYPGFSGGNLYSTSTGATLVSNQLYRYQPGTSQVIGNRKAVPTFALSGLNSLTDISGPGSVIGDTAQYSYNYCVAYLANECRPGSQAGDIFANVPGLKVSYCASGTNADLCIGNTPTFAQGVAQLGLLPNSIGEPIGSHETGAGYSRLLTGGLAGLRNHNGYPQAKSLPDGSWALISQQAAVSQAWMVKMPPFVQNDTLDRSAFCRSRSVSRLSPTLVSPRLLLSSDMSSKARRIVTFAPAGGRHASPYRRC